MAVIVTDNRTTLYEDGLTGITGASTSDTSFFAEATGCAAEAYNIATGQIYFGSALNATLAANKLLYVWSAVVATQNSYKEPTPADSSHAQYVGDGTNNFIVYQAGNDRDVFKHADTQVSFQCFLIDIDYLATALANGDIAFLNGSLAGLNEASITRVGAHYTTLSKALGGGTNCFMDIIRVGGADQGLAITGGLTGDRGRFAQIAVEDRSTLNGKAHGIIREYTGGAYGVQGTLQFGTTGVGDSWFEDAGVAVTFEDRLVADDKFKLTVLGNTAAGEETHFILRNSTIQSARPGVAVDMSSTGINTLTLEGVTFLNLKNAVSFPSDSATYSHTITGCTFNNCGLVSTTGATINDSSFIATTATSALSVSNLSQMVECNFIGNNASHAVELTSLGAGSMTWNGTFNASTYAASNGSTGSEVLFVNVAAGTLDLSIATGADAPTIRTAGATVNIVVSSQLTLTGLQNPTEVRVFEAGTTTEVAGQENVTTGTFVTTVTVSAVDISVLSLGFQNIRLLNVNTSSDASIPIQQIVDRQYANP